MSKLTWLGHSVTKLETNAGFIAYIDPWIKNNPSHPTNLLPEKVDVILVTHDHTDHSEDVVDLANQTGAKVISQPEIIKNFVEHGLRKEQGVAMNIGGTVSFNGFEAKMVHAFHTSNTGQPAGYIITIDNKVVYHLGDTGLFSDLRLFGSQSSIDYALVPVGGHFTMDYKDGAIAADMLAAKNVIPIHFKTFPILLQDIEKYVDEVNKIRPETNVITPKIGEEIIL